MRCVITLLSISCARTDHEREILHTIIPMTIIKIRSQDVSRLSKMCQTVQQVSRGNKMGCIYQVRLLCLALRKRVGEDRDKKQDVSMLVSI